MKLFIRSIWPSSPRWLWPLLKSNHKSQPNMEDSDLYLLSLSLRACLPVCTRAQGWTRLFVFVCGNSSVTVLVRPVRNSRLLSLDALVEAEIWDEVVTKWRQEKHRPHLMLWAKGNKHANTHIVRHILLHRVNSSALALSDGPQCSHSE